MAKGWSDKAASRLLRYRIRMIGKYTRLVLLCEFVSGASRRGFFVAVGPSLLAHPFHSQWVLCCKGRNDKTT